MTATKNEWSVSGARLNFSEVINRAIYVEPQIIRRGKQCVAVVSIELYRKIQDARKEPQ